MERIDHKLVLDLEDLMCNEKRAFRIWNPDLISSGAVLWSWTRYLHSEVELCFFYLLHLSIVPQLSGVKLHFCADAVVLHRSIL